MISVYCDGANEGRTGTPGGFGWVILKDGKFICSGYGGEKETTNNRQELTGAIEGLSNLISKGIRVGIEEIELVSDSKYTLNLATGIYKAKLNIDLVEKLQILSKVLDIKTRWVAGHSGEKWNEECDRLAVLGKKEAAGKVVEGVKTEIKSQELFEGKKEYTTSQVAFMMEVENAKVWEIARKLGLEPIKNGTSKKGFKYHLWSVEQMEKIVEGARNETEV